jgi:anti-anti-sigma factor
MSPDGPFSMLECCDPDGAVRLELLGELDLAVAEEFSARLAELIDQRRLTRLDLSRLEFIDSTGIHALIRAVRSGRADGAQLIEVERKLSQQAQRLVDLAGVAPILWPNGQSPWPRT